MYSKYAQLLEERGVKTYHVSKATGIASATFTAWKQGKYTPKIDKLQKIATYFDVPIEFLLADDDPAVCEDHSA